MNDWYNNWAHAKKVPKLDNGGDLENGLTLNIFEMKKAIGNVLPVAKITIIKACLCGRKWTTTAQKHITINQAIGNPIPFIVKRINSSRLSMVSPKIKL